MMRHDPVSAPSHYTVYPVQPIALTRHLGFCLGNAVKYILRAPYKGGAEDLRKAVQYLEWEMETPQPPISADAYQHAEAALDSIVNFLRIKDTMLSSVQADFLIALDGYMRKPSPDGCRDLLYHARRPEGLHHLSACALPEGAAS